MTPRDRVLAATGHILVTGGPGSGKTTIALRKAASRVRAGLCTGQKVLFLSFSRAAVARLMAAAKLELRSEERKLIQIETFHSFAWSVLRGHGYLLGAPRRLQILLPHDELARRNGERGANAVWRQETERLFREEGLVTFDLFAPMFLQLLNRSDSFVRLIAAKYPLIVVDEAQDTGDAQWSVVAKFAAHAQLICLADLDQQIYDFREDVRPDRLERIVQELQAEGIDLGSENKRSMAVEIVRFGNDVLHDTPRGDEYLGVSVMRYSPVAAKRDAAIRQAVGRVCARVKHHTGVLPRSVAILTSRGRGVWIASRALNGDVTQRRIRHRVHIDESEMLLATRIVGCTFELAHSASEAVPCLLDRLAELYRARGGVTDAERLLRCSRDMRRGGRERLKCAKELARILQSLADTPLVGNPQTDWARLASLFASSEAAELRKVGADACDLASSSYGRRLHEALSALWMREGSYRGAGSAIERVIAHDRLAESAAEESGLHVMTVHKAKGKEFDAVVVLHIGANVSPLTHPREKPPYAKSRRVLRVAVTRARKHVLLLCDASEQCPILTGHKLG